MFDQQHLLLEYLFQFYTIGILVQDKLQCKHHLQHMNPSQLQHKYHLYQEELMLQLTGIHVLQMVLVLKPVLYKYFNGIELKKIFQQKILLVKHLQELVVMLKMSVKISLIKQIQSVNMIVFGVWHVYLYVHLKLSKLIK